MPLKQAHYVKHAHWRGWLWWHHWSRLTVWTHSQLSITHISALHSTLVLCNCPIPQCSQLTGSSHALHAIPSVLTTYGGLWPQPIFPAMQMLCTDKVYGGRRRCQELNAIVAGSLTEQVPKRSIFKHAIEAGSLCRTRSSKRSTLTTPLRWSSFEFGSGSGSVAVLRWQRVWFWFCWYWTSCSSTRANSQSLSSLFRVSTQSLSHLFWCCSFCQLRFDASDSFCQSWFIASGLFKFRVSGSSYLTLSADDKRKDELRIMSRPCIERIIWVWVD